jgi:uncharacterized protein (AIM24 family)
VVSALEPTLERERPAVTSFDRVYGSGRLILTPPSGAHLFPLGMDGNVACFRADLVAGFDSSLLCDGGQVGCAGGGSLDVVRFRGDGVVVLGVEGPFFACEVQREKALTLRAASLVGWTGFLSLELGRDGAFGSRWSDLVVTFRGEGAVLFLGA